VEAAHNLRERFGELPDSHVIARLAGLDTRVASAPPLVLDGFLDVDQPSPPGHVLDHRGPWTLWRVAGP